MKPWISPLIVSIVQLRSAVTANGLSICSVCMKT